VLRSPPRVTEGPPLLSEHVLPSVKLLPLSSSHISDLYNPQFISSILIISCVFTECFYYTCMAFSFLRHMHC
jgi:hypothetical protein